MTASWTHNRGNCQSLSPCAIERPLPSFPPWYRHTLVLGSQSRAACAPRRGSTIEFRSPPQILLLIYSSSFRAGNGSFGKVLATEGLYSVPRTSVKAWGWLCTFIIPALERWRRKDPGVCRPANLVGSVNSRFSRRLSQRMRWRPIEEDTGHPLLAYTCTHKKWSLSFTMTEVSCSMIHSLYYYIIVQIHVFGIKCRWEGKGQGLKVSVYTAGGFPLVVFISFLENTYS